MKKIFDITNKDLLQMMRDWKFLFFLLVMPAGFTLLMGFVFGGAFQEDADSRYLVAVVDQDQSSISAAFLGGLERSDTIRIEQMEAIDRLNEDIEDGKLAAALIIPGGFGSALYEGGATNLDVTIDPDSSIGQTVRNVIQAEATRFSGAVRSARFSLASYQVYQGTVNASAAREYFDTGLVAAIDAWTDPPVVLAVTDAALVQADDLAAQAYGTNPYAHSSPGMMAQFAIAGLISAATVLVIERKTRALARMLTTATTRMQILLGHFMTMFVMILAQFLVLTLFGQLLLDLDYYTNQPLATVLMIVATSLFSASLGMLIATLAKSEEQVIMFTMIPMFLFSALGGAWMALELMPASMQTVGHFSPVAWIMDGFKGILIRGWGLNEVLLPAGVLLLFTLVCLGFSLWRFKFE